ncbi:MAG: glycosyltransferase, partial [Candidatus Omnitrophica bacterium]|nr:glycosyltransferase [Candidatus Omnitrophota bacterium]
MKKKATLLILNYNGKDLLEECMPSIVKAVEYDGGGHDIAVVDNNSQDKSISFLKTNYPEVKVFPQPKNDYVFSYNNVVKQLDTDYVIFLNNDIIVAKDFIAPLMAPFIENDVFAVAAKVLYLDRKTLNYGRRWARFSWGRVLLLTQPDSPNVLPALVASGGSAVFDCSKFLELEGFDRLYYPFYGEDLDISYRAWKKGWKVLYQPRSAFYHRQYGTIGKMVTPFYIATNHARNNFLFTWKNIIDKPYVIKHIFFLLP